MADEPLFIAIDPTDPAYRSTIRQARETLPEFLAHIRVWAPAGAVPCVKARIVDGPEEAFLWLVDARPAGDGFVARIAEIPSKFAHNREGDEVTVPRDELLDWMILVEGTLFGGFSLRYQRGLLPEERRTWYDDYVGIERYA